VSAPGGERRWIAVLAAAIAVLALCGRGERPASDWGPVSLPPELVERLLPVPTPELARLYRATERVAPLNRTLAEPRAGEWRHSHREPGETFKQFVAFNPFAPRTRPVRLTAHLADDLTADQRHTALAAAHHAAACFGMELTEAAPLELDGLPDSARRLHPRWHTAQLSTQHVLDELVRLRAHTAGACDVAFVASDVWPGPGWDFVYGQARPRMRVAVVSFNRIEHAGLAADAKRSTLERTVKVASHEIAHVLAMRHCTAYACNMCGADPIEELDANPAWFCPECAAKICWIAAQDAAAWHLGAAERFERLGLAAAAEHCRLSAARLAAP
jgi:archaemetzincin